MNNSENYTEVPDRLLFTIHLFLGTKKMWEAIKNMDQLFGSWLWEWLSLTWNQTHDPSFECKRANSFGGFKP